MMMMRMGMRITHPHTSPTLLPSSPKLFRHKKRLLPSPSPRSLPILSMSTAQPQSFSVQSTSEDDDVIKFGFQRPEMYKEKLANSIGGTYERHVFLCYKGPDEWAPRVEESGLPNVVFNAVKDRMKEFCVKTKFTICGGGEGTDGDVLIFPDMIKYRGLKDSDVDSFVEDVLINGKPWSSGTPEKVTGTHIFVCAHGSRDKRCGICGPPLMDKLNEEIGLRSMTDKWFVSPCSHIGGHKYAGNLIVFGPDMKGKITGHWYGYVTPDDVPAVLDDHIGMGMIIERLWRGQMGARIEDSGKGDDKKLPNGEDLKSQKENQESDIQAEKGTVTGCCQGDNGVSCCMDGNKEVKSDKGIISLSSWIKKWQQGDVIAAATIIGAVATIAVAYSYYKRSA